MTNSSHPPIWGILLAAGKGERFQKQRPNEDKLLAPLPGQHTLAPTALASSLWALAAHTERTIVITHPEQHKRHELLSALKSECAKQHHALTLLKHPDCQAGMGASLAIAAQYLEHTTNTPPQGVLVALADMPWIQSATYQAVVQALAQHPIAAPFYQKKRGHPVGFQWPLIKQLATLSGDQGARGLIQEYGCHQITIHDPGVLMDIDHPEDLQQDPRD